MKERPILFQGDMVRAILDGRKTQTRRIVKPQPINRAICATNSMWYDADCINPGRLIKPKYGQPGDRLWVKENCWITPPNFGDADLNNRTDCEGRGRYVGYSASMDGDSVRCAKDYGVKQSPSIFMPRWASRITLEIVSVRVERVQEITEEDAEQEGCRMEDWRETSQNPMGEYGQWLANDTPPSKYYTFRNGYRRLWDSINSKTYPWQSNPWVWVIEFKRVQ